MVTIKKSVHPRTLPGIHPGLQQRLREAEEAENRGETPRSLEGAQRILRPTPDATSSQRKAQVRTIGLIDPAYRKTQDGLAALAGQAPFRPGQDLDAVWDTLTEADKIRAGATERFRLELDASLRLAAQPWNPPHKLGGRLDGRNLKRANDNLRAEIDAYAYLLAPDSFRLLVRFVDDTHKLLELCLRQRAVQGIDTATTYDLLRDLVEKLIYQELTSRRRAMGDRGIRKICGNIELAEQLYLQIKRLPDFSPRERLVMRVLQVHADLGHTAYAARTSFRGSKLHRAYGARIFNDEINRYRALLTHEELELIRLGVSTHSSEEFPLAENRTLALARIVDHLTPFGPFRVYTQLEEIPSATTYLDDLLERFQQNTAERITSAKDALRQLLADAALHPALVDDLFAAFRPLEQGAEPIDLGPWGGDVAELTYDSSGAGTVRARVNATAFACRYQVLFDCQQDQLRRLARACGQRLDGTEPRLLLTRPSLGTLVLSR